MHNESSSFLKHCHYISKPKCKSNAFEQQAHRPKTLL